MFAIAPDMQNQFEDGNVIMLEALFLLQWPGNSN